MWSSLAVLAIPLLEFNTLMVVFLKTPRKWICYAYMRSGHVVLAIPPLEFNTLIVIFFTTPYVDTNYDGFILLEKLWSCLLPDQPIDYTINIYDILSLSQAFFQKVLSWSTRSWRGQPYFCRHAAPYVLNIIHISTIQVIFFSLLVISISRY